MKCKHLILEYLGEQKRRNPKGPLVLGNCIDCRSTITMNDNYAPKNDGSGKYIRLNQKRKNPTDMELALYLIYIIDNPCRFEHEVRPDYIKGAKRILEEHKFENPFARELLENKVREYTLFS